jgi:hypothetical protein
MKTIMALGLALALTGCWQMHQGGGGGGGGVSFAKDVAPMLKANCAACHTEGNPLTPFYYFKADGSPDVASVQEHGAQMVDAIKKGRMPKGNPGSVPAKDLAKFEAWVKAGAKDN